MPSKVFVHSEFRVLELVQFEILSIPEFSNKVLNFPFLFQKFLTLLAYQSDLVKAIF
jgi:hypothetical protein